MIYREDMLELTRRMTLSRSSFTRIAGCYIDSDGEFDGSFNTNFFKLSASERTKNIGIAKAIPYAETNINLKQFEFQAESQKAGSMWQLLMAMRDCGLKNDALMETFYDVFMENYYTETAYAIYIFHDRYDIPSKASDKKRLGESEEMFEYLICAVCPLIDDYEPGLPKFGFLFPAFTDRCGDLNHVNIYSRNQNTECTDVLLRILGIHESKHALPKN